MSVDWFSKLKEFDSLTKMRINHLNAVKEQENRISKLNIRRQEAIMQTVKLKQEHSTLLSAMLDLEQKLKVNSEQKQRVVDTGGSETKIEAYSQVISALEIEGLSLLEQLDTNENMTKDEKTFIEGLDQSIREIQEEAQEEIGKYQQEIKNLDMRISLLQSDFPLEFQSILVRTLAKKLSHGPFTRIESGSCFFCRYKISRVEESEIDMQKSLRTCPQCDRIFLPFGS